MATQEIDPQELAKRYAEEREKRVREDGIDQYVELKGKFAYLDEDPYVEPGFTRDAVEDENEVVCIGGGFGGLMTSCHLKRAGIDDVRIIEKGGDVGGTWYWNRYPGAACDVESYIYLPLLEEVGKMPTNKYAKAADILEHCRALARYFDLYEKALLQTEVTGLRWNEDDKRWHIETNRGDKLRARFVVIANGWLSKPKLPGVPGIESYEGHTFHTSRWDYDYTGGDADGNLTKLADKRVGVIGTGATAVQCVPHLGAGAKELFVFQRTPSSVDIRDNYDTPQDWVASLQPGWQRDRMENFEAAATGHPVEVDLVNDGWTDIMKNLSTLSVANKSNDPEQMAELLQLADFKKMQSIRDRVDSIVGDQATADALKPYYNQFCKRPCFHEDYLPTFNRPNVHLIDTDGKGIERITPEGIVANGVEYELDCIVFATGFEVGTDISSRTGYQVYGRDGLTISEKWKDGVATLHGMHVNGFPNLFFVLNNVQSGMTLNFPLSLDEQGKHLSYVVAAAAERQARALEVTAEAEEDWVEQVLATARNRAKYLQECTPGYYNGEGHVSPQVARNGAYSGGWFKYQEILKDWRESGELPGMEVRS